VHVHICVCVRVRACVCVRARMCVFHVNAYKNNIILLGDFFKINPI
jgi:hypothetical protein